MQIFAGCYGMEERKLSFRSIAPASVHVAVAGAKGGYERFPPLGGCREGFESPTLPPPSPRKESRMATLLA